MRKIIYLISMVGFGLCGFAQPAKPVLLQTHTLTPNEKASLTSEQVWDQLAVYDQHYYAVVQFTELPTPSQKTALQQQGVQLHEYLPHNTYYATLPVAAGIETLQQAGISYLFQLQPQHKLHPWLTNLADSIYWEQPDGRWELNLIPYPGFNSTPLVNQLQEMGFELVDQGYSNRITIKADPQALPLLAILPIIRFIEPGDPPAIPENYTARTLTRSNTIHTDYGTGRQYTGKNVTVGLQDDGLISNHIDYTGRVTQNANGDGGNHGDHIAGTIMGAGNLEPIARGMAYEGHLYVRWVYNIVQNMYNHYNNDDVYITSTSYSNGCNAGYTSFTQTHDQQTLDLPRLLHVFSAGNSASSNCGYGAGPGWGNITGGHKVGKNVIAVGSLTKNGELSGFSSRGPAHDGRVKPDICAKGSAVYSTVSNSPFYASYSGTSMSCPNVSGILAQLYDAYRQNNNNQWANSALIKAIILNTADDLGNPGPDYKFGWGQINALRAAKVIESKTYFNNSVQQGIIRQHQITVPTNAKELRVMVYWHDQVAAVGAAKALVNDIDLSLSIPGGSSLQPWILDPTPNANTLDLPAVRGIDTLNNVEQVTVANPAPGTYTAVVNGKAIPQGPQSYYLVYEIRYDSLFVTYPMGGESWVPGEEALIRWDAVDNTVPFAIEWTADSGSTWQTIANNIPADSRQYTWTVPNQVTGLAKIRVNRGTLSAESDQFFSLIEVPENLSVFWACGDSLKLKWDEVPGADYYEISQLGSRYMDSVGQTSSLHFTVNGINPNGTYWFSVRALNNQGASGRRARAIQKSPGNLNCIPFDAALDEIVNPTFGAYSSCTSQQLPVTIRVLNNGVQTLDSIPVAYQLDSNLVVWDTIFTRLPSAETVIHTFSTPLPPLITGNYTLTAWTALPGDAQSNNDIETVDFTVYSSLSATLPYIQNFDNFSTCSSAWGCEEITCMLSEGWYNATNAAEDLLDWRTHSGSTGSAGTGPSADHTSGNGNYLYIEGSGNGGSGCQNADAVVYSPCFDLTQTNQPKLHYWRHMEGGGIGSLTVDVFDGSKWHNGLHTFTGEQGPDWLEDSLDLAIFGSNIINIRFRGTTGNSWQTDMAIDDILVSTLPTSRFTIEDSLVCPGQTIALQSNSWYEQSQEWIITGGNYQFVNGTSANSAQPMVQLLDEGIYTISLITFNAYGTDTLTVENAFFTGPHPIHISSDDTDNAICPGTPVSFTAQANASTYQWYLNNLLVQNGANSTFNLPQIQQDTWVIGQGTLAGGCTTPKDSILVRVSQLSAQSQQDQPVSCFGGQDGIATALPFNGIPPYQFAWSTGSQQAQTSTLPAGQHQCTITDVTGCEAVTTVTIKEPQVMQTSTQATSPICFGGANGQAQVQTSGGNGNYTPLWSTGSTGPFANGLSAGRYYVTVTDAKGCSTTDSVDVVDPQPMIISTVQVEPADCFGQASGSATVSAQNGTRPYTWLWSNGTSDSSIQQIGAGSYRVTVTDANNCRQVDSVVVTQPASSLTVTTQASTLSCFADSNGTASALAMGGVGPYTYLWSTGDQGESLEHLSAGTYFVTITDQNMCGALDSIVITQPASIQLDSALVGSLSCFGDSSGYIYLQMSGGTGLLSAHWQDGATGFDRETLSAGSYLVAVADSNQCTVEQTFTVTQPDSLELQTLQFTDSICPSTASATMEVAGLGGISPYQYQWNNGAQDSILTNQVQGNYAVTVTDANGCIATMDYAVERYPITPMQVSPDTTNYVCPEEQVTLQAKGDFLSWLWSTGDTTAQSTVPAGQYSVSGRDANDCSTFLTSIVVYEHPAPTAQSIAGRDTVTLHSTEAYQTDGDTSSIYQWQVTGGVLANGQGTTQVEIDWQMAGWQTIQTIETTPDGCLGDTISLAIYVDRITGLPVANTDWQLFPNPTTGWIQLEGLHGPVSIRVLSVTGQTLLQVRTDSRNYRMDLTSFAQGLYLVEVTQSSNRWVKRVVKQ